jgi:hypothetical protein
MFQQLKSTQLVIEKRKKAFLLYYALVSLMVEVRSCKASDAVRFRTGAPSFRLLSANYKIQNLYLWKESEACCIGDMA